MIRTSDGGLFKVSVNIAKAFGVFKVLLDDKENEEVIETIHLVDVSTQNSSNGSGICGTT